MGQIEANGQAIALVLDEDGRLQATVTDGDIRRAILNQTDLDRPILHLFENTPPALGRGPVTAPQGTSSEELLRLMSEFGIRHIPIVDSSDRVLEISLLSDLIQNQQLPVTAVVMAGGRGSRLRPLTENLPQPMLPVAGRPVMELIIEQLKKAGIRRVNLTTHFKSKVIHDHFGDGRSFGVDIDYVEEDQPLGTAGSLSLLQESDDPLLVINGDILTKVDFRAMVDFHHEHEAEMTVAVRPHEVQIPYGVVETDGAIITGITEKPTIRNFINAGIYLLNPNVCRLVPAGEKYDMPDLIQRLINEGRRVASFPVHEYWLDIGQINDYEQAQADALEKES